MGDIPTITEDEYLELAREAENQMFAQAPPDAGNEGLRDIREAVWASRLCADPDDPANS